MRQLNFFYRLNFWNSKNTGPANNRRHSSSDEQNEICNNYLPSKQKSIDLESNHQELLNSKQANEQINLIEQKNEDAKNLQQVPTHELSNNKQCFLSSPKKVNAKNKRFFGNKKSYSNGRDSPISKKSLDYLLNENNQENEVECNSSCESVCEVQRETNVDLGETNFTDINNNSSANRTTRNNESSNQEVVVLSGERKPSNYIVDNQKHV